MEKNKEPKALWEVLGVWVSAVNKETEREHTCKWTYRGWISVTAYWMLICNNYKEKEKSQLLRFQAHWPKENDDLVNRNQEIRGGIWLRPGGIKEGKWCLMWWLWRSWKRASFTQLLLRAGGAMHTLILFYNRFYLKS